MNTELDRLQAEALRDLQAIAAGDSQALAAWSQKYVHRKKGAFAPFFSSIRDLPADERGPFGARLNEIIASLEAAGTERQGTATQKAAVRTDWGLDPTLPVAPMPRGSYHPVSLVRRRIERIFTDLGFETASGRLIETEYYNFEALNIPAHHPAREMQDTFYVDLPPEAGSGHRWLLRTQTSPMQIHYMRSHADRLPIRMIAPGRVFRSDHDATHSPMFQQVEGLWIEKGLSFAHLKGVLRLFLSRLFLRDVRVRLRPSYFPFTEPSAEVDMSCAICDGGGCRVCKHSGWIELLGSGMVHPEVLRAGGVDADQYTGLAFGLGVERITMLLYGVPDLRLFYQGNREFLQQFDRELPL